MKRSLWLLLIAPAAFAQGVSVLSTRHNLAVSGPGPARAQSETQICIFCHTPHRGAALGVNRPGSTAIYQPYNSTTLVSPPPGSPSGATRICLSCHDGTIALGQTLSTGLIPLIGTGPGGTIPPGASNLGTDLRRTHPVSFAPASTPTTHPPPPGDPVKLDAGGRLQCTSCHDPHQDLLEPVQGKFLVKPNRASAICLTCHAQPYWATNPSSHQSSTAFYDTSKGATTPYTTVADNACESCHRPHAAVTTAELLKSTTSQVCMQCHTGLVAIKNLSIDFTKPYPHPSLTGDPSIHDPAEGPLNPTRPLPETNPAAPRHAVCADCHNAHASFSLPAVPPRADGFLSGVWGIDRNALRVAPVGNQYEVCFKCHGDSANQPQARGPTPPETVWRAVPDLNLRQVFDLAAPSFHPVEGPGRSATVPGMIPPWTASSIIYCTDCHASDTGPGAGGTGPAGPHGSIYNHILERNFSTADFTPESVVAYALCYKCHDRSVLFSVQSSFPSHSQHVQMQSIPCSACHDWHGVSLVQGNPVNNAHLINFDVSIVRPNSVGMRQYQSTGLGHGTCSLNCHGVDHVNLAY